MENADFKQLIILAQDGDHASMAQLSEMTTPRIRAFLLRLTLKDELADDLTQETMLQMLSSLGTLKKAESFWPWIYRIAMNKANQFYRRHRRQPQTSLDDLKDRLGHQIAAQPSHYESDPIARRETASAIAQAIQKLKARHRAIISMRCFDDMPYKRIAESLDCTELYARVTFVRAKHSLRKELNRRGIKALSLLGVLTLLGKCTLQDADAAAQLTVASSTVETSLAGEAVSALTSKTAVAVVAGTVVAATLLTNMPDDTVILRDGVHSVHYVVQARNEKSKWGSLSKGAYEKWCYFPEGVDGPMILRMQRWDPQMRSKLCSWLQNEEANFYYNNGDNTVYVLNERLGGFLDMPTDPPRMAAFIAEQMPEQPELELQRDENTGLLIKSKDNRFEDAADFENVYQYNDATAAFFEKFWPDDCQVKDYRTPMCRRGWTYFKVSGTANGLPVSGSGRVPFVLNAARQNPAWLQINLPDGTRLVDRAEAAYIMNAQGEITAVLPPGAFHQGLARPWMGYSALDTVRRDAAQAQIPFETYFNEDMSWAQVVLDVSAQDMEIGIVYEIDLILDLMKSITITNYRAPQQQHIDLAFNYLEQIDEQDFPAPALPDRLDEPQDPGARTHWLVELGAGQLLSLALNNS